MYRPLDRKLHFNTLQTTGEYFGKDCGTHSLPRGQGHSAGTITTAQDIYPCIVPYNTRQAVDLNKGYSIPKKGDRPMHATTIKFVPVRTEYNSVTRYEYGGRPELRPQRRPHSCRSMHTSQIILGTDTNLDRASTYKNTFYNKYTQPHYQVLQPILDNKAVSINSRDIAESLKPQSHSNYFSEYGSSHNKLGAMLDISKPKYEIPVERPLPRQYNVLTGADVGPSWKPDNRMISGNRVLKSARERTTSFVLG